MKTLDQMWDNYTSYSNMKRSSNPNKIAIIKARLEKECTPEEMSFLELAHQTSKKNNWVGKMEFEEFFHALEWGVMFNE